MNWIIIVAIVLLAERDYINNLNLIFGTDAGPVPITGPLYNINPFILHWEPAHFDRSTLEQAHQKHLEQKNRRRKRDINNNYENNGPSHTIKLKFSAHDREFRLMLRQDPLSVFAPDAEIENTFGPVDYDISRIYTGSLEDDENSHIYAVLTKNNLIDGTISTNCEQYYIEPSERYSSDLIKSGIHTIVYKLSDVKMNKKSQFHSPYHSITSYWNDISKTPTNKNKNNNKNNINNKKNQQSTISSINQQHQHCASENLYKKLDSERKRKDFKRRRRSSSSQKSSKLLSSTSSLQLTINPFYLNSIFYNNKKTYDIDNNDNSLMLSSSSSASSIPSSIKLTPLANINNKKNNLKYSYNNSNRKERKINNKNYDKEHNDDDDKNYNSYDDGSGIIKFIKSDTINSSSYRHKSDMKKNNGNINNISTYSKSYQNSNNLTNNNRKKTNNNKNKNFNERHQKMSNKITLQSENNLKQNKASENKKSVKNKKKYILSKETVNFYDDNQVKTIKSISNEYNIDNDILLVHSKDNNNDKNLKIKNIRKYFNSMADNNQIDGNLSISRNSNNNNNNDEIPNRSKRKKRWLPEELSDNRDPPLPLDLEVPYNEEYSYLDHNTNVNQRNRGAYIRNNSNNGGTSSSNNNKSGSTVPQSPTTIRTSSRENIVIGIGRSPTSYQNSGNNNRYNDNISGSSIIGSNGNSFSNINNGDIITGNGIYSKTNRNRNILVNQYSPNSDFINNNNNNYSSNNNNYYSNISNNGRQNNNYNNNHRNIIGNSYNGDNSNFNSNTKIRTIFNTNFDLTNNFNNNNNNGAGNSSPSHKTHVEIITRNGATKRPNIIGNNYNPDVYLSNTKNGNSKINSHLNLNIRNELDSSSTSVRPSLYDRKSTCMLYLQADHTFFQKMGSDESSIEAITRHVQRANTIYRNTDFNNDGKPDNITFMIKRIKVHNTNAIKDPSYRFPGNYGVEKFLELFSEEDYDAFCLAYMFTYRDFEMGTLGLAWTGDLKNAGGVCEKNGHYRGSLKSLNTGIVTLLNYGKHVPPAVSHVTLAHEIGHNFGSPHDPEQCTPGGEDGNYIMFARATSGDKRNNNKFSPCSLKSIEPVLNAKARSSKGCFTEPQTSICGNGVVEPGEECDCGWEEDCNDVCCFPMSRHPRIDERPCTLQPRALCSPSQGPCCTTQCNLKFGDKCRDDNGCRDPSFCDGRQPQCPPSVNKPNKTICNKEFVCYMGECTGSICLAFGLESCQCLPGPNDPKTKSCELCCKEPGEGKTCKSSFEWNEQPYDVPDMFAKPGTPCNDYNGYCDVFQKCREVDPSGPLATLRKLLLSEESIASFKKWIQSNWYTVALAAVGVIVLLVLSTKLLGKRNVKLKSVTIIHSATTETVRLPEDNNGVIVHTAVRTKVPFKKKVRGQRGHKAKIITKKSTQQKISSKSNIKGGNSVSAATVTQSIPIPNKSISNTAIATTSISANKNSPSATTTTVIPKIPPTTLNKRSSSGEVLKKVSRKKSRTNIDEKAINKLNDYKNAKKLKKKKEIIDYSKGSVGPNTSSSHTNTFGKVQKWLLDSPIVSQPLSHVEHSSKIRNVMTKSQSTPDRLIQKQPQKTKSVGNLSNEKVKLQVVYKPPFKFSLKLSKNSTVKTHVIGGALNKSKRKTKVGGIDKKKIGVVPFTSLKSSEERGRRTALLIRSADKTDGLKLNLMDNSEPNYETLEHPDKMSDKTPLYENMHINSTENLKDLNKQIDNIDVTDLPKSSSKGKKVPDVFRINRSASNSHIDRGESRSSKNQQPHSYSRSNSVSHNTGAGVLKPISSSRKASDNSVNLSRNFGSTQNLIPSSHNNLTKSKKRSSLNLKNNSVLSTYDTKRPSISKKPSSPDATLAGIGGLIPAKRSSSNQNLRRENSASNLRRSADISDNVSMTQQQHRGSTTNLMKSSSSSNTKGSIKNIPRASLSNNSPAATHALLIGASQQLNNLGNNSTNNQYHHQQQQHRTSSPPNNINNINSNNNSLLRHQSQNTSNNLLGNQLNNLNKPNTAGCDDLNTNTRQSPFDWPLPNQQQQLSQASTSININHNNRNNNNTHSNNINNSSSNSSSNNSISNNSSSSSNNITNIASNTAIISNNLSHLNSNNFLLKSQQQNLTTTPFTATTTNKNTMNLNKNFSTTPTINNITNNVNNSTNNNDQKNNFSISNFNNKTISPKTTITTTSSSATTAKQLNTTTNNKHFNTNNDIEISSDLEVMVSDIENLVS